ncbi:hypothetical protein [Endozoicomonas sp.]|uniref:hypothetical protein n=1 Tax=Endozoicomonas sp. TaxID=1892382 RepID=UPI0028837918|nr:hypothetical protein [Endozoicomonas sp.]
MKVICPCCTSIGFDSQLQLADERHLVRHCRSEATFKDFSVCIEEALRNISSALTTGNEEKQLISDLRMISRSCFIIGEYTVAAGGRFEFSTSQEAGNTYARVTEVGVLVATKFEPLSPQKRPRNQVLDNIL